MHFVFLQSGSLNQQLLERGLSELGTTGDGTNIAFLALTLKVSLLVSYPGPTPTFFPLEVWPGYEARCVRHVSYVNIQAHILYFVLTG